jgi:predicted DNA-binding transcriptional regulator YafY
MEQIIKTAIENKQLLSFTYQNKNRLVEPYTFGQSKQGKDTLSAFQIEGGSGGDGDLCWRQFPMREMKNLKLLDDTFENVREDYDPDNARLSFVYWTV